MMGFANTEDLLMRRLACLVVLLMISAATGVFESIATPGMYTGVFPAMPHRDWKHAAATLRRLRSVLARLRGLERGPDEKET